MQLYVLSSVGTCYVHVQVLAFFQESSRQQESHRENLIALQKVTQHITFVSLYFSFLNVVYWQVIRHGKVTVSVYHTGLPCSYRDLFFFFVLFFSFFFFFLFFFSFLFFLLF